MSESINELAEALSKAQGEIENARSNKEGKHGKYADLASVIEIARKSLSNNGLAIVQSAGNAGEHVSVTTTLIHKSGQWMRDTITMPVTIQRSNNGKLLMNHAQAVGSIITYARRYSLAAFVGIAQEDNDASLDSDNKALDVEKQQSVKQDPLTLIQQASSMEDLRQITPMLSQLPDEQKTIARKAWKQRKAELQAQEAQA